MLRSYEMDHFRLSSEVVESQQDFTHYALHFMARESFAVIALLHLPHVREKALAYL